MAKKKKTRQQKIIADLRRQIHPSTPVEIPIQAIKKEKITTKPTSPKVEKIAYPHLISDLKKTGILTSAIVAAQVILYFLLTNNILNIPRLNY